VQRYFDFALMTVKVLFDKVLPNMHITSFDWLFLKSLFLIKFKPVKIRIAVTFIYIWIYIDQTNFGVNPHPLHRFKFFSNPLKCFSIRTERKITQSLIIRLYDRIKSRLINPFLILICNNFQNFQFI